MIFRGVTKAVYATNCYWEADTGATRYVLRSHHIEKTHRLGSVLKQLIPSSLLHLTDHPFYFDNLISSFQLYRLKLCSCHLCHAYARLHSVHSLCFSSFSFITSSVILCFSFLLLIFSDNVYC